MYLAALLADVTSFVTEAVSWITSFVGAITGQPLLLMFVLVAFVGLGIGLIGRLIHL